MDSNEFWEDLKEGLTTLSRSGAVAAIHLTALVEDDTLCLRARYRFREYGVRDGKPLMMSLAAAPLVMESFEAEGARLYAAESSFAPPDEQSETFLIECEAASWSDVAVLVNLRWTGQAAATDRLSLLRVPEHLPFVFTGSAATERLPLPSLFLSVDSESSECIAAGIVEGLTWSSNADTQTVVQAIFTHPKQQVTRLSSTGESSRHQVACTPAVVASSTLEERLLFAKTVSAIQDIAQRAYGVPLTARLLAVTEQETKQSSSPSGSILQIEKFSDEQAPTFVMRSGAILTKVGQSWWGGGIRVVGPHALVIVNAINFSTSLRLIGRMRANLRLDEWLANVLIKSVEDEKPQLLQAASLGMALFDTMRENERVKSELAAFTAFCWRTSIPDTQVTQWLREHGVVVPSELR